MKDQKMISKTEFFYANEKGPYRDAPGEAGSCG